MYISMKTYSKKLLVAFFFSMLPIVLMSCSMDPEKASFSISGNLEKLQIGNDGFTEVYSIKSNTEWKFVNETDQSWVTISPAKGSGNGTVTITANANTGTGRTAVFRVVPNGVKTQEIEIMQGNSYIPTTDGEFPIIAWTGVEADKSLEKFPVMKASGINIYLGWYDDLETTLKVLDAAQKTGVKMITSCKDLLSVGTAEEVVKAMMNHPALYAYHLKDEPEVNDLPGLGELVKKIKTIDSHHPCYINLYPNWAWGKELYSENIKSFIEQVPVPFISFDNYPIVSINGAPSIVRPDWYRNLEEISAAAKENNKPFWAFALALSHKLDETHFYKIPTLPELRLQVFSDLAYGAQAIQYFTYRGLQHDEPTEVYNLVKTVNQEVQQLAGIFLGAQVISVSHTGSEIPEGTTALGSLPTPIKSLTTSDTGAVVSFLEKGSNQYLVVVNKDFRNVMNLAIDVDGSVSRVLKDGSTVSPDGSTIAVEPGDMVIFTWRK